MSKLLNLLKQYWKGLLVALGTMLGLAYLRQYFQKDLKSIIKNLLASNKSSILDEKLSSNRSAQADINNSIKDNLERLNEAKSEASKASIKEIEDFYNKKK